MTSTKQTRDEALRAIKDEIMTSKREQVKSILRAAVDASQEGVARNCINKVVKAIDELQHGTFADEREPNSVEHYLIGERDARIVEIGPRTFKNKP